MRRAKLVSSPRIVTLNWNSWGMFQEAMRSSGSFTATPLRRRDYLRQTLGGVLQIKRPLLMLWTALHQLASLYGLAKWRRAMESAVTIGLDRGKSVFQVHGFDAGGGGCRP